MEGKHKMKVKTLYECEICGTPYKDESKCKECESSHKKIKKIHTAQYQSYHVNQKGYPSSIEVLMDDGEKIRYKRG